MNSRLELPESSRWKTDILNKKRSKGSLTLAPCTHLFYYYFLVVRRYQIRLNNSKVNVGEKRKMSEVYVPFSKIRTKLPQKHPNQAGLLFFLSAYAEGDSPTNSLKFTKKVVLD